MPRNVLNELASNGTSQNLDWVFLVDWILLLLASITIIFYFNRYVGSVISFLLRLYVWNKSKVRIKIQSVKVSLLGGRIFLKNVTVITKNETISILQCTLTWRYWLNVTLRSDFELEENDQDKVKNDQLPTRFLLQIYGLEVFMYNRMYAYENLMDFIHKSDNGLGPTKKEEPSNDNSTTSSTTFKLGKSSESADQTSNPDTETSQPETPMEIPFFSFLNSLPMGIEVKKGALVFGNRTTSSILVISFAQGDGVLDITKAKNKLDQYKIVFKINLVKTKVFMKPNLSFEENMNNEKFKTRRTVKYGTKNKLKSLYKRFSRRLHHHIEQDSQTEKESHWTGLRQYLDQSGNKENQDLATKISVNHDEYAKHSELLDAELVLFCYYYDVVGTVPVNPRPSPKTPEINNGGSAPTYGMYFSVSKGAVHYGPWAHRERIGIQKMLFPTACRDAKPHELLIPGEKRKYTEFKLKIHVIDDLVLRIPFREFSKNVKVQSEDHEESDVDRKPPFGWLEFRLQKGSTFGSRTSYIPTIENGWDNSISLELFSPEVRSSTNHDIFLKADKHYLFAKTGFPLEWNGLTNWKFQNTFENTSVFLLREHVTLVSDMLSDFSYGPAPHYELFKPFIYDIDLSFEKDYKLYLNVNDNNVINNALDFNDNVYLSLQGDTLLAKINVPLDKVVRKCTDVTFELSTDFFDIELDCPPWHTLNNFMKSKKVARSKRFKLDGAYISYAAIEEGNVDTIVLDCDCEDTVLEVYGFLLRYFLKVKENYFGIHRIFKTLLEYTEQLHDNSDVSSEPMKKGLQTAKIENEMDLQFSFSLRNGCCVLPGNIYNCDSNIPIFFDTLEVDIRYTNYYMDLQCDISKLEGKSLHDCQSRLLINNAFSGDFRSLPNELVIEKLTVHGHRMFGLPPVEPTYFCKWDFGIGRIILKSGPEFFNLFLRCFKNLGFSLKDAENLFVPIPVVLHDIVVVTLECPEVLVDISDKAGNHMALSLSPITFNLNDLANMRYSKRLNLKIPDITFKITNNENQVMSLIQTSLYFTNFVQHVDFYNDTKSQQEHITLNDGPFHRLPFFISKDRGGKYRKDYGSIKPSFSLTSVPPPLNAQSVDFILEDLEGDSDEANFSVSGIEGSVLAGYALNHSDQSSSERENGARSYYTDSEFSPNTPPDPKYEYDNLIANLGTVQGFLNPKAIDLVLDVLDTFFTFSLQSTLDNLHITTIKALRNLSNDTSSIDNIRVVAPVIDLRYGHFDDFDSIAELSDWSKPHPSHIELSIHNLSAAISLKKTKEHTGNMTLSERIRTIKEMASALHIGEMDLNIVKSELIDLQHYSYSKVMNLSSHDLELWNTQNETDGLVGSVNNRAIELSLESEEVKWLADFFSEHTREIKNLKVRFQEIFSRNSMANSALLFNLSTAGLTYHIQHDPAVLTKPAYIMRSSPDHVRSNDSWKVIVRLRHILQNLPKDWVLETNGLFDAHKWNTNEESCSAVLNVFSKWRSWEFSDISKCYVFRKVFKSSEKSSASSKPLPQKVNFALEKMLMELTAVGMENDFISLDFLNLSLIANDHHLADPNGTLDSPDLGKKRYNAVFSLDSINDRITSLSSKLKGFIPEKSSSSESEVLPDESAKLVRSKSRMSDLAALVEVAAVIHKAEHNIELDSLSFQAKGEGLALSGFASFQGSLNEEFPLNAVMGCDSLMCNLSYLGENLALYETKKGSVVLSSAGLLQTGIKNFDASFSEITLKLNQGTEKYLQFLTEIIEENSETILKFTRSQELKMANKNMESTAFVSFSKFPILVSLSIEKVTWDIEIISPIKYFGYIGGFSLNSHVVNDVLITSINSQLLLSNITSHSPQMSTIYLKSEISKFDTCFKILLAEDYHLFNVSMKAERAVLTVPQLIQTLSTFYEDKTTIMKNVEKFKTIMSHLRKDSSMTSDSEKPLVKKSFTKPLIRKISVKIEYAGVIAACEGRLYRLDTKGASLMERNYIMTDNGQVSHVQLHGEMNLPSSRFVMGTGKDEVVLSNISLAVKVVNPDRVEHKLQTLQVELRYLRLFLSPEILCELMLARKAISKSLLKFKLTDMVVTPSQSISIQTQGSLLGFYSIHILAYNICLGWIFNQNSSSNGLIVGCERIFVVSEEKVGKLTLVDAYLSVAQGNTPSTFFSEDGEFNASNRAFLPNMQLVYAIFEKDGLRRMHTNISGEMLDARFEANGVNIIEDSLKSISYCKALMNERVTSEDSDAPEKPFTLGSVSMDKVGFHSLECVVSFAGAKVFIYNTDAAILEDCSSFTLESPAVKIAMEFENTPELLKKHKLEVEILTSSSRNVLFANCVPVITNLYHGVRKMMRKPASPVAESPTLKPMTSDNALFDDISINIGLRVEPQEIALSCEPVAKVEARGLFKGLEVRMGTCEHITTTFWTLVKLDGLEASLQHVYSRETSGSINIDQLLLTAFYNYKEDRKLSTSCLISDARALINVKQLQDLDLFKDIWIPKELFDSDEAPRLEKTSSISGQVREKPNSSAVPWIIDLLIQNVVLTVDMGKSLGVLTLGLNRFWAVSKKSLNWEQNLRMSLDTISLTSKGRLGGEVLISDITVLTAISFVSKNKVYEHPLVVISASLSSIQARSALDFHTFFVCNIQGLAFNMFNKRGRIATTHDSLYATAEATSFQVYFTALAASNFWDIYNTLLRIHKDIQISYTEVLKDSSNKKSEVMLTKVNQADEWLAATINGLTTNLDVKIGQILVHIYPSSLVDSQVLTFRLGEANAKFYQNTSKNLENRLRLTMNDFTVSLSSFHNKVQDESDLNSMNIESVLLNSRDLKGGTIFVFPSMVVNMDIWQDVNTNIIEYKYHSSFGGKVDIRWNLGSVNFIRDMWTSHANALSSRLESYRRIKTRGDAELKAVAGDKSIFESVNLEGKLKDVEMGSKYKYIPLEPMIAEAPQLKELGEATPPLEWFGLHRANFPNITHQMIILSLQKMVHEVETEYAKILR